MKNIFRKAAAGLAALTICTSFASVNAEEVLKGDADNNGVLSGADLVTLSSHLLGRKNLEDAAKANADMNDDGDVNVIDFIMLKNIFMGAETPAAETVNITLSGESIKADEGVTVEGTKVTIAKSGNYSITGEMKKDAQIIVATAETDAESVNITLNGVTMTNSADTPCIMIENADKTKITFTGDNVLTNTIDAADAASAVIYAKDDLTFTKNSTGTLKIESNAQMGIYCNNDIKFNGGNIKIKTDAAGTGTAKADAVKAKGNVEIIGGELDVNAAGDGIKSSKNAVVIEGGKAEIKSGKDAIQGETAVTITDGNIVASGDRGITVSAGNFTLGGGTLLATSTEAVDYSNVVMGEHFSNGNIVALALSEQHSKSEVLTIAGKEFTAAKKYQYIFATYPDLAASSANVLLIDGKKAEFTVVPVGK